MAQSFGITRMRLERLGDERDRTNEKIQDLLALAEEEQRDLADYENEQVTKYRTRVGELENEILDLSTDIERANRLEGHLQARAQRGRGRRRNGACQALQRSRAPPSSTARSRSTPGTRWSLRFPQIASAGGGRA